MVQAGHQPLLHDEFNDKFTYVITTMTTPRTYVEDLLCHLGVGAVQRRVRRRDMQRTFPNCSWTGTIGGITAVLP